MKLEAQNSASQTIKEWLAQMSDPSWDPWPGKKAFPSFEDEPQGDVIYFDPIAENDVDEEASDEEVSDEEASDEEVSDEETYRGKRDLEGHYHLYGTVTYPNGDVVSTQFEHGVRHGDAVIISPRTKMVRIVGTYVQNRLQGKGRLVTQDKQISDCFFRHGSLHGPLRRFKLKKFREFRQQLDFVGTYRGGKPSGVCWQYREGGGWLVGAVDSLTGEFTANTGITYIYPDFYTAVTGAFRDGVMTGASATHLIDVEPDTETQILTPLFAPVKSDEPIVAYSKATTESIGDQPMIADPYESRTVEVNRMSPLAKRAFQKYCAIRDVIRTFLLDRRFFGICTSRHPIIISIIFMHRNIFNSTFYFFRFRR